MCIHLSLIHIFTALGISRESKSLGYARQSIDTESLLDTRDPNLLNSLSGKVSGVNFISNGGPLSSTRVEIRGNNSLTGNNQPLYVDVYKRQNSGIAIVRTSLLITSIIIKNKTARLL